MSVDGEDRIESDVEIPDEKGKKKVYDESDTEERAAELLEYATASNPNSALKFCNSRPECNLEIETVLLDADFKPLAKTSVTPMYRTSTGFTDNKVSAFASSYNKKTAEKDPWLEPFSDPEDAVIDPDFEAKAVPQIKRHSIFVKQSEEDEAQSDLF